MRLLALNLENFRNIESASLSFQGDRIFLLGPNGQGKTNLLEAIGLSASLRSFRKNGMDGLVRDGSDRSQLFFQFTDDLGEEFEILVGFRSKGEKTVQVNGEKINRLSDYLGKFPAVTLSSGDFRLIRESPSDRRKWLDLLLSSCAESYIYHLQSFHRALRERNSLLKKGGSDSELSAFEHALAHAIVPLQTARKDAFPRIREILEKQYDALCSGSEKAGIDYRPDLPEMSIDETLARLESGRERDRILGVTRRGPHRDDFVLTLNQLDAKTYASEGQQRGLVLALRLAEFSYLRQSLGRIPLLLADDVLGELDGQRKSNFRKLLPPEAQVFATGTSYPSEEESVIWETFEVRSGGFTSKDHK